MKTFTGYQYLLIDIANQWGLDKLEFEDRIKWTEDNIDNLVSRAADRGKWKEYPLYMKAVQALRDVQAGEPIGHMVGFDAVCSGLQIMSATVGCEAGALATGLIDPDVRMDAYTKCTEIMKTLLPSLSKYSRKEVKAAVMTVLYGSKKEPIKIFGEDTPELNAFYKAMYELSPGACELLQDLLDSWVPHTLEHSWVMPDNTHVHVKVMETVEKRIEVDELDHSTFTYQYQENVGSRKGLSNAANVIHSIDGYVLRSLIRRCSYDPEVITQAYEYVHQEMLDRLQKQYTVNMWWEPTDEFKALMERYESTAMVDIVIASELDKVSVQLLSDKHLVQLESLLWNVLNYKPFHVIAVHDEFKCHANNMNTLRYHYKEIMADLADSEILSDIFNKVTGVTGTYNKLSTDLGKKIRNSNYGLC